MNVFKRKLIIITITTILLVIIILVGLKPKLYLIGDKEIEIPLNAKYNDLGATAYRLYNDISDKVEVNNNINNKKIGTYKVEYKVKYLNKTYKKTRIVKVIDNIEPVIILKGNNNFTLCPDEEYQEEGFKAIDNYDGDITNKVMKYVLNDKIVYRVKDKSGNIGTAKRTVIFEDKEKPIITLNGGNLTVYLNDKFIDPGLTVTDNCDKDIHTKVKTEGNVNTKKEGIYKIKYTVIDESKNKTEITRTIHVTTKPKDSKVIYLTFDDGPSSTITPEILKILKEENVKATFFIINHNDNLNYLIKQEYIDNHTVAIHSYTHNYQYIYSAEDVYFNDLELMKKKIKNITGFSPNIFRFPGGSSNTVSKFNPGIMSRLAIETKNRGYIYFDWNVESGDAGSAKTKEDVYTNVTTRLTDKINVVLMHDYENNYKTLEALREIIKYGKENGYTFEKITENTPQIKHGIAN